MFQTIQIMTKKFWCDWQKKIYATKGVWIWGDDDVANGNPKGHRPSLCTFGGDCFKILSAEFKGDNVDLVVEVTSVRFDSRTSSIHGHVENHKFTLKRKNISSVEFFKK